VRDVEGGCCGLADSWGFENGKYGISMDCGEQALLPAVRDAAPDVSWQEVRRDGFVPIGAYGVIGDGRSAALVAADGAIDWWAVPAMDSPPVFAAMLDPATGGSFTLEPAVPYRTERRYLPGSNVLETTFHAAGGTVTVTDALTRDLDGLLRWTELVREVRAQAGEVPMRWRAAPGDRLHQARPRARWHGGTPLLQAGDQMMITLVADGAGRPGSAGRTRSASSLPGPAVTPCWCSPRPPVSRLSYPGHARHAGGFGHHGVVAALVRVRLLPRPRPGPGDAQRSDAETADLRADRSAARRRHHLPAPSRSEPTGTSTTATGGPATTATCSNRCGSPPAPAAPSSTRLPPGRWS
jgi:hypothetical protein